MAELFNASEPWMEFDRGHIGGDGIAIRKCSADFLSALYKAYDSLVTGSVDSITAHGLQKSISQELHRLQLYPTLYPAPEVQSRFCKLLVGGLQKYIGGTFEVMQDADLDEDNLIAREMDKVLNFLNQRSYKENLLPWEQFLLRGSPGSGVKLPNPPPNAIVRLMPIGGVALHLRWLRARYLVGKKCREVSGFEELKVSCYANFSSLRFPMVTFYAALLQPL
ncbi:predicted protein [Uncinocarpus reesii 1704]|uniref:Uncharacterized protein n=1 Tax=Uncinocarpus reesii (strain UAMH 1704) TaxID=336963 RepID=C4JE30_UNCRE|nr:uncharacterized protein UREG_00454 [Uncinocarpus reesii 1704]EEP75608.1 predicted protein [Uncinocarpus reesii 1704]